MELVRIDDYQSWGIRGGGAWVVIDPWLVGDVTVGGGVLFRRRHRRPPAFAPDTLPRPDLLVVTAAFGDHMVLPTLRALDRSVPVWAQGDAARVLGRLGYGDVATAVAGDERHVPGADGGLVLRAVAPDRPYRTSSIGLRVEEPATGARLYLETHVVADDALAAVGPVDVAVLPVESVRLLGTTFAMDGARALAVVDALDAHVVVPTGTEPRAAGGLLPWFLLRCAGDLEDFRARLAGRRPGTVFRPLGPGESVRAPA